MAHGRKATPNDEKASRPIQAHSGILAGWLLGGATLCGCPGLGWKDFFKNKDHGELDG